METSCKCNNIFRCKECKERIFKQLETMKRRDDDDEKNKQQQGRIPHNDPK